MSATASSRKYARTRMLTLGGGIVALGVIAVIAYARRVDAVEVAGTLLFVPVFIAFLFGRVKGGLIAGIIAAIAYGFLRAPTIEVVGLDAFAGLLASRVIALVLFGAIGGWAVGQLQTSLTKLDVVDRVDDVTGLGNARSFLSGADLEMSRATRYRTIFSVVVLDFPSAALAPLSRRNRARVLKDLGQEMRRSLRTVDSVAHVADDGRHRLAVILPETPSEGALITAERLTAEVTDFLRSQGSDAKATVVRPRAMTLPADEKALRNVREEIASVDRREHPETAKAARLV